MKQIRKRTSLILLLLLLLSGGLILFCVRYVTQGEQWASFSANDHVYTDGHLSAGQILDRSGTLLYDPASDTYNDTPAIRKATLHAVGDRDNNISTSVKSALCDQLVGFNPLTGTTFGGHKLYLTLDASLCETAYEALDGRKGTVGVYNYKTGEILCMVSTPTFDPDDPPAIAEGDSRYDGVYLNRFLSSTFTPGSVFKIITTAAALENMDLSDYSYTCTGQTTIDGNTVTCSSQHGTMDLYGILANSCNCAYAHLAAQLGGKTLEKYAKSANLLDRQMVSGITTAAGSFKVGSDDGAVGWSGVGQYEDLVNPCALMALMGSIASDDQFALPRLVAKETSLRGLSLFNTDQPTAEPVWTAETRATLRSMMANNVEKNYGQSNFGDLAICAKSGTAEVGSGAAPHAWFTGFLDDPLHPLAFTVLVENGGSGAHVAGSIAAAVLQQAVDEWED